MAVNGNNYDIEIKKEPDIDIEIIDHEIKEEPGHDYEDYLENINNVIIKEEVILSGMCHVPDVFVFFPFTSFFCFRWR